MIVAIHQPQYLPWLPYCAKAGRCDLFVYLDTVQYQKNGLQNRNQIKSAQGAQWLTVPVNASLEHTIRQTRIADQRWSRKHIQSIRQNYARAPFLDLFEKGLRPILEQPHENLADLNIAVTEWMFGCLGIGCKRVRGCDLNVSGTKDDLVISICEAVGATVYLSGQGAAAYQDENKFRAHNLELRYHHFQGQSYPQCHAAAGFVPDLSALDVILNLGPQARETIKQIPNSHPLK